MSYQTPDYSRFIQGSISTVADPLFEGLRERQKADTLSKLPKGPDGKLDYNQAIDYLIRNNQTDVAAKLAPIVTAQQQQGGMYGTPIWGSENGQDVLFGMDKGGGLRRLPVPPGVTLNPGIKTVEGPTGTTIINNRTGLPMGGGSVANQPPPNMAPQRPAAPPTLAPQRGGGFAPQAPLDPAYDGITPREAELANSPQPGSAAPIQPRPVQTQSMRPGQTPGFIPKDIEDAQIKEAAGKRAGEAIAAASKAPQSLANLNRASALLAQVETGKLLPAQMTVGAWGRALGLSDEALKSMGLNPAAPAVGQAAQSLFNELIIGKLGPGGFPTANFSNTDLKFITGTVMGLGDEPAANKIRIEAARRIEQQKIEKVNQWREFKRANPQASFDDFEAQWNDRALKRDLFGDLQREAEQMIARATAPAVSPPTSGQANGGWQTDPNNPKVRYKVRQQ